MELRNHTRTKGEFALCLASVALFRDERDWLSLRLAVAPEFVDAFAGEEQARAIEKDAHDSEMALED
jgi:hypothetical protein